MSIPAPMECKDSPCRSPTACNSAGQCLGYDWSDDAAKSYDHAIEACRDLWRAGLLTSLFGQPLPHPHRKA